MVDSKRNIKKSIAFLVMFFCLFIICACTFTEEKAQKELEVLLMEQGGYEQDIFYEIYEGDYDKDTVMEAFIVVFKEGDVTAKNRDEAEKALVDLWYYDDTDLLVLYQDDTNISARQEQLYVMELSDKTFFVYEQPASEDNYKSRVLGVRDGKVLDYFCDPKLTEYYNGQLYDYEGNDLWIWEDKMNAKKDTTNSVYFGKTRLTGYVYYDVTNDKFCTYTAYERLEDEIATYENGEEIIQSVKENYPKYYMWYDYAVRGDYLHIMVTDRNAVDEESYYYHTYKMTDNAIGELVESGEGFYDDLNTQSVEAVNKKEWEADRAFSEFMALWTEENSQSITESVKPDTRYECFGENRVTQWIYEMRDIGDVVVWTVDASYETAEGKIDSISEAERICHESITTGEEFEKAYYSCGGEDVPWDYATNLSIPDFFENGMAHEIAKQELPEYYQADTAAIAFFHLTGGTVANLSYEEKEIGKRQASLTYIFADGSTVDLYMYETYLGVWLPLEFEGQKTFSVLANEWFLGLTEEDYTNAKKIGNDEKWFEEKIVLLEEFSELNVKIYGDPSGGIVVESSGKRTLFAKPYLTTRISYPQFNVWDYDGDGNMEIGMISYVGSGTGIAIEDFCIIDSFKEDICKLSVLSNTWCVKDINSGLLLERSVDNMNIYDLCVGDFIFFYFGDNGQITCEMLLEMTSEDSLMPNVIRTYDEKDSPSVDAVKFDIFYDENMGYTIGNYRYAVNGMEKNEE